MESCFVDRDQAHLPVTASFDIPATSGMYNVAERYRLKALASERFSQAATDPTVRTAWVEIAIEWHTLSNRAAQEYHEGSVEAA
jgi:hypothetical protein